MNTEKRHGYSIVRFFKDQRPQELIKTGLTLQEAQDHCNDPSTSTDEYFDGYYHEESE